MPTIQTSRLHLIPVIKEETATIADFFLQLSLDSRFILMAWGEEEPQGANIEEVTKRVLAWKETYKKFGMGWYLVRLNETNEPIGYVFLRPVLESQLQHTRDIHPNEDPATFTARPDEIELGYGFATAFWGKGYATEAVQKIIDYGFQTFDFPYISGAALTNNIGSQRVMEKAGMREIKGGPSYYGTEDKYYEITRRQWQQTRQ